MRRRLLLAGALFALLFGGVTARLVGIQVVEHAQWASYARSIQEDEIVITAPRGRLLDRNGILLAQDLPALSIALDNYHMSRPEVLVEVLQRHLNLSPDALNEKIYRESYFTWIARQVPLDTAEAIRAEAGEAGALGLLYVEEPRRVYPQRTLASNVIGFTGLDHRGLEGAELAFESWLGGSETVLHVVRSASGVELVRETRTAGGPGADVVLTLDARIQRVAESALDAGIARFRAKDGFVVVLDPRTGAALALAQATRYDLNDYAAAPAAARLNQPVARAYEPGSLFKVFTGLAALESGAVGLEERFDGDTKVRIGGHAFGNAEENHRFGWVNLHEIIQNSVNIGMVQVAQRVGETALYRYLRQIGIGEPTGLELPGELGGSLIPLERWSPLEIGAVSIGQAVTVTGIQLASKLAAIGNEGRLMQPHVLREVRGADGTTLSRTSPRTVGRLASLLNTQLMRRMMESVVEAGTGTAAQIPGFAAAGKSGTAQKVVSGQAGYADDKFISSFGGFFPSEDARYFILVVLDEVGDLPVWGGRTAGSVFKQIAEGLINLDKLHPEG